MKQNGLEQWQNEAQELRAAFLKMLGQFPEREPVEYEILPPENELATIQRTYIEGIGPSVIEDYVCPDEEPDNPDYTRLHIRYPSCIEGQPVYAYLRIPKSLRAKAPAVLCLHGHVAGSFFGKEFWDVTAIELTKRGFITLTPDMLPFGERRETQWDEFEWKNGQGSNHFWGERCWFQSLFLKGQTLLGLHVWELQRAIDILESLDEVDSSRIGATGHSGGGMNTLWLSALDERIACAASSAGVMSYSHLAETQVPNAVWGMAPILTVGDTPDLLGLVAPRPFLGVESNADAFGFDGDYNQQFIYPQAREKYALSNAEDRLKQIVYSGDHEYFEPQRALLYQWLERWLKPHA